MYAFARATLIVERTVIPRAILLTPNQFRLPDRSCIPSTRGSRSHKWQQHVPRVAPRDDARESNLMEPPRGFRLDITATRLRASLASSKFRDKVRLLPRLSLTLWRVSVPSGTRKINSGRKFRKNPDRSFAFSILLVLAPNVDNDHRWRLPTRSSHFRASTVPSLRSLCFRGLWVRMRRRVCVCVFHFSPSSGHNGAQPPPLIGRDTMPLGRGAVPGRIARVD